VRKNGFTPTEYGKRFFKIPRNNVGNDWNDSKKVVVSDWNSNFDRQS